MLTRLTPLAGEAILPLAEAKAQLRITHTREDGLISALRDAAVSQIERLSGIAFAESEFLWTMSAFPVRIELPMRPATDIEVTYYDSAGTEQIYADARLLGGFVYPAADGAWPDAYDYAAVGFTAGLESPSDAPELITAAKLLIGHLYVNREASSERAMQELPFGVTALIGTYRQVFV